MSHFLFFSYATGDDPEITRHKRQFFDDLVVAVASHRDYAPDMTSVGFLDADMVPGADWGADLGSALQTCRVFVYLQEQAYFNFKDRPWCGREWHVFQTRVDDHVNQLPEGTPRPPLAIPVIWQRMPKLPKVAEAIQFQSRNLGDVYSRLGLGALKSRPEIAGHYVTFVTNLAHQIVTVANAHRLTALNVLPQYQNISDPWVPQIAQQLPPRIRDEGPRYVDFVYVVATKDQIRGLRTHIDGYDDNNDARLWRPYFPPAADHVANMAEMRAHKRNLIPSRIDFGPDLIDRLQAARDAQRIVVLIIDPWSLQVPECNAIMTTYGTRNFWNCVVVVPWNEDDETRQQASALANVAKQVFFNLREEAVLSQIRSSRDFVRQLEKAFLVAHKKIEDYATFRAVDGVGLRRVPGFSGV